MVWGALEVGCGGREKSDFWHWLFLAPPSCMQLARLDAYDGESFQGIRTGYNDIYLENSLVTLNGKLSILKIRNEALKTPSNTEL